MEAVMSQFHNFFCVTGFALGKRSNTSNWVMSTEVWQIQARRGSGVELPTAEGLILDVICLFHVPTTTTNVLKLIQALQELFSLVHRTLKVCSLTCDLPSPLRSVVRKNLKHPMSLRFYFAPFWWF